MGHEEQTPRGLKGLALSRKLYDIVKFSVDMDIFSKTDQAVSLEMLVEDIGVDAHFLELLLGVLENAGFMGSNILDGTRSFMNTGVSRTYLSLNSPYFIGDDIFNDADTYDILSAYVSDGPPDAGIDQSFWTAEFVRTIGSKSLMGPLQETLESVDLTGRKRLLDVGGGHALYSIFFTRRYPPLEAWVLDLPAVIPTAEEHIQKFGASDRVHPIACALENLAGEKKYDVVFASNYAGSRDRLWDLVSRSRTLLEDNGWLIVRSYARDVKDDAASALVSLDRYARRGHPGLASADYISALEAHGFTGIVELYRGDGVIILKGKKDR
jgi:precorrin-6B methylase 2